MTAQAYGKYLFVKRDEEVTVSASGLDIPDAARIKPNTGVILSVGALLEDKSAKPGKRAIFNKTAGAEHEVDGEVFIVLREEQLLGTI